MSAERPHSDRRRFLGLAGITSIGLMVFSRKACAASQAAEPEEEVSPAEDLMREHGVLNRLLLIYEESMRRLGSAREDVKPELLAESAGIIRSFIEDYHEKLEEEHLFPRFEKAGKETGLVRVLRQQHDAGRRLTEQIIQLAKVRTFTDATQNRKLSATMQQFIRMYRPHESREDTVLFPALHQIVSRHEYDALGEDFEKQEHQRFGADGFETMVDRVARIERALGIYELAQFTPKIEEAK
ncbi:MAG TPA: hemerythrin domain-containing protein [Verrucomicrobiae bacterium]|nr:hemerythrin domain-containing protein [Verrucomicrobiae bacterium]